MMYGWILILVLLIAAIWYFSSMGSLEFGEKGEKPLDRLKKRYADGEISTEEFEARKKKLEELM